MRMIIKLIDKDAVVAEIKERIETYNKGYANGDDRRADALEVLLHDIDTLEVKEVDLELIVGWFDHIAQIVDDRKTLNGDIMEDWAALDEIKCLAKNSSEFIKKHYKAQKGEEV